MDTKEARQERKQRVLTQGQPAIVSNIADAVTVKDLNLFYVIAPDGQLPLKGDHGFGLYLNDCRFLSGYEITIADVAPLPLATTAEQGYRALFELTNPDLHLDGRKLIPKEKLGIRWERVLNADEKTAHEILTFRNFGQVACELPVTLRFLAGFEDIFKQCPRTAARGAGQAGAFGLARRQAPVRLSRCGSASPNSSHRVLACAAYDDRRRCDVSD